MSNALSEQNLYWNRKCDRCGVRTPRRHKECGRNTDKCTFDDFDISIGR